MHAGDAVASYAPAPWTLMTGRSIPKATSDLRSWKGIEIYAHGVFILGPPQIWCKMRYTVGCVTP